MFHNVRYVNYSCTQVASKTTTYSQPRTGKADTRTNIAKRVKRAAERANKQLAEQNAEIPTIPVELSPHSLRRTFGPRTPSGRHNPTLSRLRTPRQMSALSQQARRPACW
jgi:hypothetical protein